MVFGLIRGAWRAGVGAKNLIVGGDPSLSVAINIEKKRLPNGEYVTVGNVDVTGTIRCIVEGVTAMVGVVIEDVTEDPKDPKPVLCSLDGFSKNGVFLFQRAIEIPYQTTGVKKMPAAVVPFDVLEFPGRGKRALILHLFVEGSLVSGHHVQKKFNYESTGEGYLDKIEKLRDGEILSAKLAVAVSASDGDIDKLETQAIKAFFGERLANASDGAERKQKITTALQDMAMALKGKTKSAVSSVIKDLASQILALDNEALSENAFELCLKVVISDGKIESQEREVVELLRDSLGLSIGTTKSLEDRFMSVSLYVEDDIETQLGMPKGLSIQEKKAWLAKDYNKWKNRVTHSDPNKAREAEARLDMIARVRSELD